MFKDSEELLRELVAINSIFPNEKEIGEYLYNALKERGFEVQKQEVDKENERYNILGIKGKGPRKIGFYAHMDTVPIQGKWIADPFELRVEGNKAIGLGAWDMKAGIVAILNSLENNVNCEVRVAFGVDEENNSLGAHKLSEIKFFEGCDLVVVPEINDSLIQEENVLMLGRRGRVRYEIKVFGQSCHAASGEGINAIKQASRLVLELENMPISLGEQMQGSHFVNAINARAKSLSFPDECIIEFDVHLVDGENENSVLEKINKIIEKSGVNAQAEIQKREVPYLMPYWTKANVPEVKKLSESIEKKYGSVQYSYGRSTADECLIAKMAPVVTLGPLGENAHKEEEWLDLDSLEGLVNIIKDFVE